MQQTRRAQSRHSLARVAALIALLIGSFTTCKLDKLLGPSTPPATKLVFQVQPQNALATKTFGSAVKVFIADAAGDTVGDATNLVSIALTPGSGTAGAVLGGTTTALAVAGVATFSNLTVDRAGSGYTLTASATPLTPAVSSSFSVIVPPTIALAPSSVTFAATVGGANPATQTVAVTNSGGSTLNGLAIGTITYGTGGTGWLVASLNSVTAPGTITLTATTGALAVGTYTATVPVTSTAANVTNSPLNLTVTFTVSQAPTIALSATTRTFSAAPGGATPASQTVSVTNTGTGTLNLLAIGNITYGAGAAGWLTAVLDVTTAPATVTLTATTAALAAGTYSATVPVTSTASGVTNSPQNISVTYTLTASSTIVLTPTSRTFTATAGGASPATNTVAVTNSGAGTLSGLAIGTITYGAGATGWLAASLGGVTTAPATVTLTPTTGTLAAGTYTATVPVTSSATGVTNSPQNIAVTFTVGATNGATTIASATPVGISVSGSTLYWGDYTSALRNVAVTGGTVGTGATGLAAPRAVTTDAFNIYWIESTGTSSSTAPFATTGASIRTAPLAGGTIVTLASGLTVARTEDSDRLETDGSFVYFIATNASGFWTIRRVPIGGGAVVDLATTSSTTTIPGFTVSGGVLYYTDGSTIKKITNPQAASGFTVVTLASAAGYVMRNAVVIGTTLYFSGRACSDPITLVRCYEILSVPTAGGSLLTKFSSTTEWAVALATDGVSLYALETPSTSGAGTASVYRIDPSTFVRTLLSQTTIPADGGYKATLLINGAFAYWTDMNTGIYRIAK